MGNNLQLADAGQELVLSHLHSIRIIAGFVNAEDYDIVANIGAWRTFEVKSSWGQYFSKGGGWGATSTADYGAEQKRFTEHKCDAFAFVSLGCPYPYYIAIEAMTDTVSLSNGCFTRAGRDMSFGGLLNRWNCAGPKSALSGEQLLEDLNGFSLETMHQAKFPGWD